ncbi:peptidoglycan/LPS O-acetylase OafA/YrhL [Collimonas sp. PA-H2]|uniref:acyltransferase family protein n=1 Tax=Collimonas sp. PA-H2 TaxID=1881062 RepID=UPI000BF4BA01|nr:acyltransferase [Collimonas sp. PA-H2]PFH08606.1 peptidoglycan/LPS O-acetylase OafA/YrhL [Collimonas sp. PA-H2]
MHPETGNTPSALRLQRTNNFNLCRLVLAILVIVSHGPELIDGNRHRELLTQLFHTISFGEFAVDGFFLISGYLIVQSWHETPQAFSFLKKRVLRIFPAFVAWSLISAVIVGPLAAGPRYFIQFDIPMFVWNMLTLQVPRTPLVFMGSHYALLNGSMWTISFEFKCYLAVLAFGVSGLLRHRITWLSTALILLALNAIHNFGVQTTCAGFCDLANPIYRLSMFFFAGGSFYLYRDSLRYDKKFLVVLVPLLLTALFRIATAEIALATLGGYLLFYFALTPISALSWFNKLPDVSYGLYLSAWPVTKLLIMYYPGISAHTLVPLTTLICIILGTASWYVIEKPFLKLKNWQANQAHAISAT